MFKGAYVFSQVMSHLPMHRFRRCVDRYAGNRKVHSFTCLDQFISMAFAQITQRESLRDIETCLRAHAGKLYHLGLRGGISRNTLANANRVRDHRIYADFAFGLIDEARKLYADDDFGIELENTAYAFDSSTVDLCLSVFPWARFRSAKAGIKIHTLLDLRGNIPAFVEVSEASLHDVNMLDQIVPEPGAFYVMDRGYLDFARLHSLSLDSAYFVIRAKSNLKFRRTASRQVDKRTGLRVDQTVRLTGPKSAARYPDSLRRIRFHDDQAGRDYVFLTNNFNLPAQTIANLYRCRWQVELFFKWIKQHLRIKSFYGTSENAVKTQIWIAVTVYVLAAIIRKRLDLEASLHTILQVLSVTLFEKDQLNQLLAKRGIAEELAGSPNQLILLE